MLIHEDTPAINQMCLNCKKPSCPGICDDVRVAMGEITRERNAWSLTWGGVTRTISEWAEILGVSKTKLYDRMKTADDVEAILTELTINDKSDLPRGALEETCLRISTMHMDYKLYWEQMLRRDGSAGMVARYGAVRASPTHATSNPTVSRALPELSMTDEALYKRAWIACVLMTIEVYRANKNISNGEIKARILEWRAIEGLTLKKIAERLNEGNEDWKKQITVKSIRNYMERIMREVAREALKRGLIRVAQK